nr:MAG TPA: cysteine-rich protein [Caudoviricetes sp.]
MCPICSSKHVDVYKAPNGLLFVKCSDCGNESSYVSTPRLARLVWLS